MDLGLYDVDSLSLFGGDLLVGLPPTSAELKVTQDIECETVSSPWATNDLVVSSGQDELANSIGLSSPVKDQPLEISWMDSRVDLLDLLAQEGENALIDQGVMVNANAIRDESAVKDDAVKILQSIAEETTQMLAAEGDTDASELQSALTAQAADNLQSVVNTDVGPTSVEHLLDMLANGMDPEVADMQTTLGDMSTIDSDILTSVTAEDVDSILSSGPSSPADLSQCSSPPQQLPPEQSNSLLAQYLLGNLDTSPQGSQSSFDISDLESVTSDLQTSDDDSDYVPSPYRVSKTRSTPYARSKAKSDSKSKANTALSKEARTLDRKLRKKQQNKDAATRYRQKKREEADLIDKECQELEDRNTELKDKVDQMAREIGYLKNLLAEVYKARGLMKPKLGK